MLLNENDKEEWRIVRHLVIFDVNVKLINEQIKRLGRWSLLT